MDLKEVMAINVRRVRPEKKLTQEDLADRGRIKQRYLGLSNERCLSGSNGVGANARALRVDPLRIDKALPTVGKNHDLRSTNIPPAKRPDHNLIS